jgi:predicted ArsR family transcriptional regulator
MTSVASGRTTRMDLLAFLRRKGPASAETIAAELGVTPNAVRQHLTNLERDGLVTSESVHNKRGRPSLEFSLTDRADTVFPKRYGQLATMVLTELQSMNGPDVLDDLFRRIALRYSDTMRQGMDGLDFNQKLTRLLGWINRAGTLAEAEETDDGIRISIHNCPFRNTALKYPQVCTITPHLMVELLDAEVSQASSIHRQDPYCSFVIRPPAPDTDQR